MSAGARLPSAAVAWAGSVNVAVPPPATVGLSLWGRGDWDDVTIVFECNVVS